MRKLINILIICFLLIGCSTTNKSVKPIQVTSVKPIPTEVLIAKQVTPKTQAVVVAPATTSKPFLSFKHVKGGQVQSGESKPLISQLETNTVVSVSSSTNRTISDILKVEQKKKTNNRGLITYYSLVLGIAAIWFFYGRTKILPHLQSLFRRSQKK